jgi:hypothetical protein
LSRRRRSCRAESAPGACRPRIASRRPPTCSWQCAPRFGTARGRAEPTSSDAGIADDPDRSRCGGSDRRRRTAREHARFDRDGVVAWPDAQDKSPVSPRNRPRANLPTRVACFDGRGHHLWWTRVSRPVDRTRRARVDFAVNG